MKTLAQPRLLALSLLCAAGFAVAATTAHASSLERGIDAAAARVGKVDPYTDGAFGKRDPYTDGAFSPRNPYTDGARSEHVRDARDSFAQGA